MTENDQDIREIFSKDVLEKYNDGTDSILNIIINVCESRNIEIDSYIKEYINQPVMDILTRECVDLNLLVVDDELLEDSIF